jgi:tetraacyldisaccharide 4'-kinase
VARGLSRADAVILMGDGPIPDAVTTSGLPIIRAHLAPTSPPPAGALIAFAGIGRPEKFFDSLTAAGGTISESVPFSDHHTYSAGDLTYLRRLATERGATLITTTKDHTRLPTNSRAGIEVFPVEAVFDDTAALDALIADVLKDF